MLTIIWTSYTLKQKRYKIIIKEQDQTIAIVNKIFNATEPLIRKALSITVIQCSLRRFVIWKQSVWSATSHFVQTYFDFFFYHILIFYHSNHVAFGLDYFVDNGWCHHIELLLERGFHSMFRNPRESKSLSLYKVNFYTNLYIKEFNRILHNNLWHKYNKRTPPFYKVKLNAIISNILIYFIHPSHILVVILYKWCFRYIEHFDEPTGRSSWQFEARVTTLLSFHLTTRTLLAESYLKSKIPQLLFPIALLSFIGLTYEGY